ncbi:MAG: hypothetical protein ACI31M_02010 [Bacilli bacterium]
MTDEKLKYCFGVINRYQEYKDKDFIDYYDIVGVNRYSSLSDIKKVLRNFSEVFKPNNISLYLGYARDQLKETPAANQYLNHADLFLEISSKSGLITAILGEEENKAEYDAEWDIIKGKKNDIVSTSNNHFKGKEILGLFIDCITTNIIKNGTNNAKLLVDRFLDTNGNCLMSFTSDNNSRLIASKLNPNEVRKELDNYFGDKVSLGYGELLVEEILEKKVQALNIASLYTVKKHDLSQLKQAILSLYNSNDYSYFTNENGARNNLKKNVNSQSLIMTMGKAMEIKDIYEWGIANARTNTSIEYNTVLYLEYISKLELSNVVNKEPNDKNTITFK